MIGGDVVVLGGGNNGDAEGGGAEEGGADTAVRTGGKTRAWDGCVARIDVSNLSKGRHTDEDDDTAVRRRGRFGGLGSTHPERKFVLDEGNRWKTEARIAAGGTGGTAELERLRRAAQRLEENNKEGGSNSKHRLGSIDAEDEDAPVVVAPEELTFGDDGWATTTETAETAPAILNGTSTQPANESSSLQKDLLDAEMRLKTAAEAALLDGEDAAREIAARAAREAARRERLARTLGNLPGDEELPTDGSNGVEMSKSKSKKRRKKALVSFDEED